MKNESKNQKVRVVGYKKFQKEKEKCKKVIVI